MYQTILDAMQALSDSGRTFGLDNSRKGEKELQNALGEKLEELTQPNGWTWRYQEERFKTYALTNRSAVAIDLVGRHRVGGMVAIELKYVVLKKSKPDDGYAFPWNVAKDSLKLDLMRAGMCHPASADTPLPHPTRLQTYCIGMTNWPCFWEGRKGFAWATKFLECIQASTARLEGLIETTGPDDKSPLC